MMVEANLCICLTTKMGEYFPFNPSTIFGVIFVCAWIQSVVNHPEEYSFIRCNTSLNNQIVYLHECAYIIEMVQKII